MTGSLVKISSVIVNSTVATATVTGIDSTFDVYKIVANGVRPDTDGNELRMRFTVSGTAQTTSNYDWSTKRLRSGASFTNDNDINQSGTRALDNVGTGAGEFSNAVYYLFNFNNSSEFSTATMEVTGHNGSESRGFQGGTTYTVAEAHDGVQFYNHQGNNIQQGSFVLYGLKK